MTPVPRSAVVTLFYRSRFYRAWVNRCAMCLICPFHGKNTR
jgi:hypothetical protein